MKKNAFLIFVLLLANMASYSQSPRLNDEDRQACLPEGIYFATQEEIDNFQTNYPNCTEIEGQVIIGGGDITNLNGLSVVTSIGGGFAVGYTDALASLTGLENLTSIEGDLYIYSNDALTSLTGLEGLTSIGGYLKFYENDALTSLTGLEGLTSIAGYLQFSNNALTSLTGLENLISIGGDLRIYGNTTLTNLIGLIGLTSIGEDLEIYGAALTSLTGLEGLTFIGGNLDFNNNNYLTSLTGLDNLTSIGGNLDLYTNNSLTSLTGLEGLNSIGGYLEIYIANSLTSLTGLESLTSIGEGIGIYVANSLTSLTGMDNLTSLGGGLGICQNNSLTICAAQWLCNYISNPSGAIEIYDNAPGCSSVIELANACGGVPCLPYGNYGLYSQSDIDIFQAAFPNCTELQGIVSIGGNDIISLNGLSVVSSIEGDLYIYSNDALTSLTGLDNLTSIGGGLEIGFNDALISLTGLENLDYIGGISVIFNDALTSLTGLDNIDAGSIANLYIYSNILLSTCAVQGICDYLAAPNGIMEIYDNAPGCDSPEEVEAACNAIYVEEINTERGITITPNPSSNKITILNLTITGITQLSIFNVSGEKVIERQLTDNEIQLDISALTTGIYFVRVQNESTVDVKKILKQ